MKEIEKNNVNKKIDKILKENEFQKGITLIALVITIIVLLILAGVTISLILGQRNILQMASDSVIKSEKIEIIERAKIDIMEKQTQNLGKFKQKDLEEILNKYGTLSNEQEENILDKTLTTTDQKHQIKVNEIWNKPFEGKISFTINGLNEQSYNGTYEVEKGTTWEEFINATFPKNFQDWVCIKETNEIIVNIVDAGYVITFSYLITANGNNVKRNDVIIER